MNWRNIRIRRCYGGWRLVKWLEELPGWGRYRIIWPKVRLLAAVRIG